MEKDTDVNARLEFNIGIENPSVWIGNVKLEEVDITIDYDAMKKPLSSGNHIYNGTFDRGNIDRKTYWNLSGNAEYSVAEDTRELYVNVRNGGTEYEDVVLNQKGIMLVGQANHKLSFNARATENKDIQIAIKNNNGEKIFSSDLNIGKEDKRYTILFNFDNNGIDNNGIIEFLLGSNNLGIYIDNVVLECDGDHEEPTEIKEFLIYNGTFENGLDGWQAWNWEKYDNFISDIKIENEQAIISIPKFGQEGDSSQTWGVQFKQTGLQLVKNVEYELSFDISSTIERELEAVIQNSGYYRVFEDKIEVNTEMKNFKYNFKANETELVELNFLLGKYGEYEAHEIIVDNVILKVKATIEDDADEDNTSGEQENPEDDNQNNEIEIKPEYDNIVAKPDTNNSDKGEFLPETGSEKIYLLIGIALIILIVGGNLINRSKINN